MTQKNALLDTYNRAEYRVTGHGKRNIEVLKAAFEPLSGDMDSDMYGSGEAIEAFQDKFAGMLGKPSAVFFPSGTMAQQIALRIWCDRSGNPKVAYHPLSHLEIHEEDGLRKLHGIDAVLLADRHRLITLQDVERMEDVSCLLLELPQREIGGQLPTFAELEAISALCRERGIRLHLDGARLFEVLPYYGKSATELCGLFNSVYISFYKGIGGIAGALLAGDEDFAAESKIWKRRHGGDLISLYPYFMSADYYFEQRIDRMDRYYREAIELAAYYNRCQAFRTVPEVPVSNMFHVHIGMPKEELEPKLLQVYEQSGVALTSHLRDADEGGCYFEVSIGDRYGSVPKDRLEEAFRLLNLQF